MIARQRSAGTWAIASVRRLAVFVPLRHARRAVAMRLAVNVRGKTHLSGLENPRIHDPQVVRHPRTEAHVRDDVALRIESRCDLDQHESLGADREHSALRDEQRDLIFHAPEVRAVADLLQLGHEFLVFALLADHGLAVLPGDVEIASSQRASEHDAPRVLADVNETADTDDLVAEAADVDVSPG